MSSIQRLQTIFSKTSSRGRKRTLIIGLLLVDLLAVVLSFHALQAHFDGRRAAAVEQAAAEPGAVESKYKHESLYNSMKDWFNAYVQNVLGTLATLVVGIGWILTSKEARNFLRSHRHVIYSALAILEMICLAHIWVSLYAYSIMDLKYELLSRLRYLDPLYFKDYKLTMAHCIVNLLVNIALFKLQILMVYSLRSDAREEGP